MLQAYIFDFIIKSGLGFIKNRAYHWQVKPEGVDNTLALSYYISIKWFFNQCDKPLAAEIMQELDESRRTLSIALRRKESSITNAEGNLE